MDVFPNVISRLILDFFDIDEQNYFINNWKAIVNVCDFSAKHGYLNLLKWARSSDAEKSSAVETSGSSQNCDWDALTFSYAAENNHLELLQWARSQGCPWDKWTCANAAMNGHLELLQWARSQGCVWDKWTCAFAAKK